MQQLEPSIDISEVKQTQIMMSMNPVWQLCFFQTHSSFMLFGHKNSTKLGTCSGNTATSLHDFFFFLPLLYTPHSISRSYSIYSHPPNYAHSDYAIPQVRT